MYRQTLSLLLEPDGIIVAVLLGAIGAFLVWSWRQDRIAALLFAPYAAWVAFASVLNASIYSLNDV